MRSGFVVLWLLLCSITSAGAQLSIGIAAPGVSIGISVPVYPELVPVPGYPVYYAPQMNSNYFFYDGLYWVYQRDHWYASSWYNGPWGLVAPEVVPLFVLRVPVRYYRRPPTYFHAWASDMSPRWGEHWGNAWEQQHSGWDNWNRASIPAPAPLPVYQQQYSGNRYPRVEQQQVLQTQNYRYQPQDAVVLQHYQAQRVQTAPAATAQATPVVPQQKNAAQRDQRNSNRTLAPAQVAQPSANAPPPATKAPVQQSGSTAPPPRQQPQQGMAQQQAQPPANQHPQQATNAPRQDRAPQAKPPAQQSKDQPQAQQPKVVTAQHQQQAPPAKSQDKGQQGKPSAQEPKPGKDSGPNKGEQQGGEHNK
jgi:hypothetical protein